METIILLTNKKVGKHSPATNELDNFDSLYKRYVGKIYQKCLSMTKDPEVSKDCTQEIFIKAYVKLSSFQNRSAFSTWLYSVAHNYCLDQIRLNKRTHTEMLSETLIEKIADSDQAVTSQWQLLERMMNDLSKQEATLLRLKYEQGLSVKAISEQCKLSESAVKMRLLRTRDKLQNLYVTIKQQNTD